MFMVLFWCGFIRMKCWVLLDMMFIFFFWFIGYEVLLVYWQGLWCLVDGLYWDGGGEVGFVQFYYDSVVLVVVWVGVSGGCCSVGVGWFGG